MGVFDDASALHFGRQLKNVAIARSGVYLYTRNELAGLGLTSIPDKYVNDRLFTVYRPASVIAANVDKFVRQPLTNTHPSTWVTPDNSRDLMKGWVGDSATIENSNDEIIIRSSVNLVDKEVIKAYDNGVREVSPGYIAKFSWREGKTKQGESYQIVMDDIESVNHLALVPEGRGGPTVRILDDGANVRKLTSGLFRWVKNLFVHDSVTKSFREVVTDAVANRESLKDEDFDGVRDSLEPAVEELPESESKTALKRMIYDLWSVKNLTADGATKYASVVSDLYEKLDTEATKSVTDALEGKMEDEEKKVDDAEAKAEEKEVVADAEAHAEPDGDEKKETKDDAPAVVDNDARFKALEDQMTKIAAFMETFGQSKTDAPASKSSEAAVTEKPSEEGVLVAQAKSIGDAAPVIEAPAGPFTATMDSKPSKSPKGIDLEEFDKSLSRPKISNGGKK